MIPISVMSPHLKEIKYKKLLQNYTYLEKSKERLFNEERGFKSSHKFITPLLCIPRQLKSQEIKQFSK